MQDTLKVLSDALAQDSEAQETFVWMAQSHRRAFNCWVHAATSEPERRKRVRQALDMLAGRDPVRRN